MFPLNLDVELFENFEGLNVQSLNKSLAKWWYSDYEVDFINDIPYSLLMKNKCEKIKCQMVRLKKQAYDKCILTADKMPVGMYTVMNPFTNHKIKISKGDLIYLFSDGFADQFGGLKEGNFCILN